LLALALAPLVRKYTATDMPALLPLSRKNLLSVPGPPTASATAGIGATAGAITVAALGTEPNRRPQRATGGAACRGLHLPPDARTPVVRDDDRAFGATAHHRARRGRAARRMYCANFWRRGLRSGGTCGASLTAFWVLIWVCGSPGAGAGGAILVSQVGASANLAIIRSRVVLSPARNLYAATVFAPPLQVIPGPVQPSATTEKTSFYASRVQPRDLASSSWPLQHTCNH